MRLLLDTHALLWWDVGRGLSAKARQGIARAAQVLVSAVSGWEVAIKAALGRLSLERSVAAAVAESGFRSGVRGLPA